MSELDFFSRQKNYSPSQLKQYHDALLFICAWPYDKKVFLLAQNEISRLAEILKQHQHNKAWQYKLSGSGLPFTELRAQYSESLTLWLLNNFHRDVRPAGASGETEMAKKLLQSMLPGVEFYQASQDELNIWKRVKSITGYYHDQEALQWMANIIQEQVGDPTLSDLVYDNLKIFLSWKLNDGFFTRSFLKLSPASIHFYKFPKNKVDRLSLKHRPPPKEKKLSKEHAEKLITIARVSLAMYYSETDPFTYADEHETALFDFGGGLQIALIGMIKERQLSLENYIGYLAFQNGIPVAYGGGWLFGYRCKIGINTFPPFRGGRSSELFLQVMRLYQKAYSVKTFEVKSYQFGKNNSEGIKTGAFWFYYKLGFRPANLIIKKIAEAEYEKIKSKPSYRSPAHLLRSFTNSHLELKLKKIDAAVFDAEKISLFVTNMIKDRFGGNRENAIMVCKREAMNFLGLKKDLFKNSPEKNVFTNWSLLLACLPGKGNWNKKQRRQFLKLIEWKVSGPEKKFLLALQHNNAFWLSVKKLVSSSTS